ncbi:tetratricopeptide repeat protein [bacterium]|nr:tetratricopeptide repeat protein [bacterium]
MPRPRALLIPVAVCAAAAGVYLWSGPAPAPVEPAAAPPADAPPIPVRPDSEAPYRPYQYQLTTDQSIKVFEGRVRDDPNHLNLTHLGGLYVRKARESGDHSGYDRADAAFRRALDVLPNHGPARVGLALVTTARHKFADGLKLAEVVYRDDPAALDALAVIVDARLELGDYDGAERAVRELEAKAAKPAPPGVRVLAARLAELRGDPGRAIDLLQQAADAQTPGSDLKESQAWYRMRLGELLLSVGRLDEAAARFEAALRDHPDYPAALGLLARVRAAQGRDADAIELCEKAARITPEVATLALAGDLRMKRGEVGVAGLFYGAVEQADADPVGSRDLVLYYCDHDKKLPRALELAEAEAKARRDVYTCDSLAWALLRNGRLADAERVAADALRLGTKDALLLYHAGAIALAAGKPEQASALFERALAANPHFSDRYAADARRHLADAAARPGRR